jgi:NAD(P)-dependent dehydrogenase (short-subunit alcohol dehydrogenase family)
MTTKPADPAPPPFSGRLLEDKVAIITGASRGIGAVAARAFAAAGAAVVLAARDERALDAIAREIIDGGGRALVVPTDVGDRRSVERLVRWAVGAYGRLDAAFNNAGVALPPTPLADVAVDDFDHVLRVDLRGTFLAMKYEIPALIDAGGGSIVNMSSTAGLGGAPGMASYTAAKHGVIGLTRTAALDYASRNIRVNALAPGPIATHHEMSDAVKDQVGRSVPLQRMGRPEEVAAAAVWLCSDQASFVSGAVLPVDGGKLSR